MTQPRPRWTIVEGWVRDAQDHALCRCRAGHEQVVAIDVSPQPDCTKCERKTGPAKGRPAAKKKRGG